MAKLELQKTQVGIEGLAPIMFDRFIDHSAEQRPTDQKMYLEGDNELMLPAENIYAFLFGANTPGCAKLFEGKKGKLYINTGQAHLFVEPVMIPFKKNGKVIKFAGFDGKTFWEFKQSACTKKGSLVIKQEVRPRPVLNLPWSLEFTITLLSNDLIDMNKL